MFDIILAVLVFVWVVFMISLVGMAALVWFVPNWSKDKVQRVERWWNADGPDGPLV